MNQEKTNEPLSKTAVMQSGITEELLQKIKFVLECKNDAQAERIIEQYVFFQEGLTIDFVEWIKDNCVETPSGWQINGREYSSKNLYEIFKRERL